MTQRGVTLFLLSNLGADVDYLGGHRGADVIPGPFATADAAKEKLYYIEYVYVISRPVNSTGQF